MAIDDDTILTWLRVAANRRFQVTNELFPGGLEDLNDYTSEEIKDAVKNFRSHPTANQRFVVSANSTKKLVQLTLWVKDRIRLGQVAEFEDGTTQAEFVSIIDEAQQREQIRHERKKNAEGLATMKIDPPLKASSGWDGWKDSVNTALTLAYGSKGVPLLYVIRDIQASTFPVTPAGAIAPSWEEVAIGAAPLTGLDYDADRKTVHLFLSNNISEDSDAHAYIHPLVSRNDGRLDWQALCERYENEATIQARVNQANKTWEMLVYKNERAMSFEAFSKKLTKALQYFEAAGRPKHDGDVIDWIWRHVQCGELSQHMSALKVGQSIHVRTSKQILQELAKEVPNLSKGSNFEPRISEIHQGSGESGGFTFDGSTPSSGAHASDGKLYCGTYSPARWFSDDVKPFHDQIREQRSKQGQKSTQSKNANRKLQQLQAQCAELKRNLSALKAGGTGDDDTAATEESHDNAGDAFGGKESMKKKAK
jgi:hypothetical protein